MARLDWFLISQDWLDHFGSMSQLKFPRPTSENLWLKVEDFQELLRGWWQGISVRGTANFVLTRKFKEIKALIKVWNKESFGRLEVNRKLNLRQVEDWDCLEEERGLVVEESEAQKEGKEQFKKWVLLEEVHWRQKSRDI